MVEEDTVRGVHVVGLAWKSGKRKENVKNCFARWKKGRRTLTVVLDNPETVELGNTVGGAGVEGSSLRLGSLDDLSVELGGGGLLNATELVSTVMWKLYEGKEDEPGRSGCGW